ncbi:hypothetical protein BDV98DRAFT_577090 [Pterulicium gracile]|uniref:Uncharacterized protein n=1 Tax=Pterulicium gracile TaxID=1884261 RepID=A0A5C3QBK4_9AGAR|nr:hypothetical protein BDV98DRAFT_577090 [Pterula gracilis]
MVAKELAPIGLSISQSLPRWRPYKHTLCQILACFNLSTNTKKPHEPPFGARIARISSRSLDHLVGSLQVSRDSSATSNRLAREGQTDRRRLAAFSEESPFLGACVTASSTLFRDLRMPHECRGQQHLDLEPAFTSSWIRGGSVGRVRSRLLCGATRLFSCNFRFTGVCPQRFDSGWNIGPSFFPPLDAALRRDQLLTSLQNLPFFLTPPQWYSLGPVSEI